MANQYLSPAFFRAAFLAPLSLLCAVLRAAGAQESNLGFEQTRTVAGDLTPVGWVTRGNGYAITVDTTTRVEGRSSLRSRRAVSRPPGSGEFGVGSQPYALNRARGRSLRLTGWIRTDSVVGYAGLWARVDGPGGTMLALENMARRGPRGTTPWTRYEVEVLVDSSATGVVFGILHPGSGTAWFDSLGLEVVGASRPRAVPPASRFEPGTPPAEDFTRLLTDAELAVIPDAAAPLVNAAAAAWVRAHARPIRSLSAGDFSDLRFLAPLLAGKRIVQLGESGHGVREFNMIKVRLIQYLHEELGYDVLAFESSLFECDRTGRDAWKLAAIHLMQGCIFSVWQTEELLRLFEYVKHTHTTARPLLLAGFDVQSSSRRGAERPRFLRDVIATIDTAYAQRVYAADSAFVASGIGNQDYARTVRDRLVPLYDSLERWLRANERTLAASFREDPAVPILARQTAASLSVLVRQHAAGPGREGTEHRDRGMADNLDFLLNELHPARKVIVWGHNFHLRHGGFGDTVRSDSRAQVRTMGTYVAERHRSQLYTVGLYMYRGSATFNNRVPYAITPVTEGSLESILHRSPWRYSFIDISRVNIEPGTEWMARRIPMKEWGVRSQPLVPRDEYDGIIFIDRVWPPKYAR